MKIMGKISKYAWYLMLCLMVLFSSCQKEESEFISPDNDTTIPRSSLLSTLMKNVLTHDGSFDDVVDKGNCYSIKLPYTIRLNGRQKRLSAVEDYVDIVSSDAVVINFPVTITFHDYVEMVINNKQELDRISRRCASDDNDIECIDFVYPFRLSTFNPTTNSLQTTDAIHDQQLFNLMKNLPEQTLVSINYPIDLLLHNGTTKMATHNTELQEEILEYANSCDEND